MRYRSCVGAVPRISKTRCEVYHHIQQKLDKETKAAQRLSDYGCGGRIYGRWISLSVLSDDLHTKGVRK